MIKDLIKCAGVIAAFATIGPLVLWFSDWED
jgi:hypothetical protein